MVSSKLLPVQPSPIVGPLGLPDQGHQGSFDPFKVFDILMIMEMVTIIMIINHHNNGDDDHDNQPVPAQRLSPSLWRPPLSPSSHELGQLEQDLKIKQGLVETELYLRTNT